MFGDPVDKLPNGEAFKLYRPWGAVFVLATRLHISNLLGWEKHM
jgi:hypothetical protein